MFRLARLLSIPLSVSAIGGIAVLFSACTESETTTTDIFAVTSVSVNPEQFLGAVACVDGGMRRYVATLVDVSPLPNNTGGEHAGLALPSSEPTPCIAELRFERVVIGREYVADVQGYDREDIVPLGCFPDQTPGCAGSAVMVDRATGAYVAPRWKTSCGRHQGPPGLDAGVTFDAGPVQADSGVLGYLDCRGQLPPVGQKPWLEGPVCVQDLTTITVRGCDPLRSVTSP
jgi:hypothetical protein